MNKLQKLTLRGTRHKRSHIVQFYLHEIFKRANFIETESILVVIRMGGREMGTEFAFEMMKMSWNVTELVVS